MIFTTGLDDPQAFPPFSLVHSFILLILVYLLEIASKIVDGRANLFKQLGFALKDCRRVILVLQLDGKLSEYRTMPYPISINCTAVSIMPNWPKVPTANWPKVHIHWPTTEKTGRKVPMTKTGFGLQQRISGPVLKLAGTCTEQREEKQQLKYLRNGPKTRGLHLHSGDLVDPSINKQLVVSLSHRFPRRVSKAYS